MGRMTLQFPSPGYWSRMNIYLAEMLPLHKHLLVSVLLYLGVYTFVGRVNGVQFSLPTVFFFLGIGSLLAVSLLIRLMDEIKDKELDEQLFSQRPLPSGRVFDSDIRFSIAAVAVLYLAANFWTGPTFGVALIVLAYAFVMFKHFFMPHILQKNLLLTLATHNPIVPIVYLHLLALFTAEHGLTFQTIDWRYTLPLILMYWAMSFAWEIARKIRSPQEENQYVTYSRIFGPRGAVLVAAGAQTVSFAIGLYFYWRLSLSPLFAVTLAGAYAITIWGHIRFMLLPSPATSKLKNFAELFIILVLIAQSIEHGLLS